MIGRSQQTPPERTGGALEGITVLEFCGARGHFMGKLMGDMGARVIGPDEVRQKLKLEKRAPA